MRLFKRVAFVALMAVFAGITAFSMSSCAKKDEVGRKYKTKTDDMSAALAIVDGAKTAGEQATDIEYDVELMVQADTVDKKYNLGFKNSYAIKNRYTEDSNIFCSMTYYGTEENEISMYYRHDQHMYLEYCNTLIRIPMTEKEFYEKVSEDVYAVETSYFKASYFSKAFVYTYEDGSSSAIFKVAAKELGDSIAKLLGVSSGDTYSYEFRDMLLCYDLKPDGTFSRCVLTFEMHYYKALTPNERMIYIGDFACDVKNTGDSVKVKTPPEGVSYSTVSDYDNLMLITEGYNNLGKQNDVKAELYRKVVSDGLWGKVSQLERTATYTQTYREGVYTYGGIDLEKGKEETKGSSASAVETQNSVGVFIDADGKSHYRDLSVVDGELKETKKTEDNTFTVDDLKRAFSIDLMEEAIDEEQVSNLTVTEQDGYIIFTYEYDKEFLGEYTTYLLEFFDSSGGISLESSSVIVQKNKGTIKVRLSDGCLVYHKIEFEVRLAGYNFVVKEDYTLDITGLGDQVDSVLDLDDWDKHKNKFN